MAAASSLDDPEMIYSRQLIPVPKLFPVSSESHPLRLVLLQYNILAQGLVNRKTQYPYLSKPHAKFRYRRANLSREIEDSCSDIACFQEMDHYGDFWSGVFDRLGMESYQVVGFEACEMTRMREKYHGAQSLSPKRRSLLWGLCVCWKRDKFDCVERWTEAFCDVLSDDADEGILEQLELKQSQHFAMFCVLRTVDPLDRPVHLLVVTAHLFWRPLFGYVRVRHMMRIREIVDEVRERYPGIVPIFMGDLNTSPNDPPYLLAVRPDQTSDDLDVHLERLQMQFPKTICEWYPTKIEEFGSEEVFAALQEERKARIRKKIAEYYLGDDRLDRKWFSAYGLYQTVRTDRSALADPRYGEEPAWTTYMSDYRSVLDYVLFDHHQVTSGVVEVTDLLEIPELDHPLPDGQFSSDHMSLVVKVSIFPDRF